ncbi:MAG: hypothetical protein R2912_09445 [Eubacteriales bacterium]
MTCLCGTLWGLVKSAPRATPCCRARTYISKIQTCFLAGRDGVNFTEAAASNCCRGIRRA